MAGHARATHGIHSSSTNLATVSIIFFAASLTRLAACTRSLSVYGIQAIAELTYDGGNLGRHGDGAL